MSELGDKQELFSSHFPLIVEEMIEDGFQVRIGDLWAVDLNPTIELLGLLRGYAPEYLLEKIHVSLSNFKFRKHKESSCHYLKLAGDVNLMKEGILLENTSDHLKYGEKWESFGSVFSWGGRYNDGNHYSIEYQGFK